jgi:UDPglucose--hexose-1-phosphate uridylyltransferase
MRSPEEVGKEVSELRQDPVSGDWVVIATGRAKRPDEFKEKREARETCNPARCVFENPEASGNETVTTIQGSRGEDWWIKVIKNKFPMVEGEKCGLLIDRGPYMVQPGAGHHEVVVTRDHSRSLGQMSEEEVLLLIKAYIERYNSLSKLECSNYILIFHNHGKEAGASIPHPHSQIIAIPVIPPDVHKSLHGSQAHFEKHGTCVHCAMIAWEKEQKSRIIFENEHFIVISPYVPRSAFEIRIYPKIHSSYFEKIGPEEQGSFAEAFRITFDSLFRGLNDPAYNAFIHTSPAHDIHAHEHYHWHVEILPKPPTPPAGFELGTGVDVSVVDPDEAASYLRAEKSL